MKTLRPLEVTTPDFHADLGLGMFLLAKLIVSNLMDQVDVEQIEVELEDENLPRKLDEA